MAEEQKKRSAKPVKKPRSPQEMHDLELAGGVEGGMPAGSAGGPGEKDVKGRAKPADKRGDR
jgi:hypothetical protein